MINDKALVEQLVEFEGWSNQKLVIALKQIDGKFFIDMRKWIEQGSSYYPTKKGITLEIAHWNEAIKHLNEIASANVL